MEREKKEMTTKSDKNVEPVSSSKNSTRKRTRKWLFVILAFGILVGSFYGIRWLHYYITHASTDDANVEGDLISVSSTVSGKIRQIPIREGEQVKKGQLIAQLREEDYQAKVDVAAGAVPPLAPFDKTVVELTCGKLLEVGVSYDFKVTINPDARRPVTLQGKAEPALAR